MAKCRTSKDQHDKEEITQCVCVCVKFHVSAVVRPMSVKLEGSLVSRYRNTSGVKNQTGFHKKSMCMIQHKTNLHSPTMQLTKLLWSIGLRWWWSTESQITVTRWSKEAVHICKDGQQAMNRMRAGITQLYSTILSHAYNYFLDAACSLRVNNWNH